MPITKTVQADNGITINYHRAVRLEVDLVSNAALVTVNSHATEQAAVDNLPLAWQWRIAVPVDALASDEPTLLGEVERALVSLEVSPFAGGELVIDASETLDAARERAWSRVKVARAQAEDGNFVYDGDVYQADKVRINGAVQLAVLAKSAGQPFRETWTLTDNSTRTLDADQVIALGLALGQYVSDLYATGRDLRAQIEAAETAGEVQAIGWPA
jgi:hypothetical protein